MDHNISDTGTTNAIRFSPPLSHRSSLSMEWLHHFSALRTTAPQCLPLVHGVVHLKFLQKRGQKINQKIFNYLGYGNVQHFNS